MLELLAGPFPLHKDDGTLLRVYPYSIIYDDKIGFCFHKGTDASCYFDVYFSQLDGLCYLKGYLGGTPASFSSPLLDFVQTTYDDRLLYIESSVDPELDKIYEFNKDTLMFKHTEIQYTQEGSIFLRDRTLKCSYGKIYARPIGNTTSTIEYTFSNVPYNFGGAIHKTNKANVVCIIDKGNSIIAYYDFLQKKEVDSRRSPPNVYKLWYSPKLDVFVALNNDFASLSIYATTSVPFALSNPTPVTPIIKGKVSDVRVRLTGSAGEPCFSELIEWSLSGPGFLSATESLTDFNGYATVKYTAPFSLSSYVTIGAKMSC